MEDVFKYRSVTEWNGYVVEFGMPSSDGNLRLTEMCLDADSCLEATKNAIALSWIHSEFAEARTSPVLEIIRTLFGGDGKAIITYPLIVDGVYYIMAPPTEFAVEFIDADWFIDLINTDNPIDIAINTTSRWYEIPHGYYYWWATEQWSGHMLPPIEQTAYASRHARNPRFTGFDEVSQTYGTPQDGVSFGNRPYTGTGWYAVGDWDSDGEPWVKAEWRPIEDVWCSNYWAPNNWQNCSHTASSGFCRQVDFQEPLVISNKHTGRCTNPDHKTKILCTDAGHTWIAEQVFYSNKEEVFPAFDEAFKLQPLKEEVCVGFGPMLKQEPDNWTEITRWASHTANGIYGQFMSMENYLGFAPDKVILTKIEFRGDFSTLGEYVDLTWPLPPSHQFYNVWGGYGPYGRWPCGTPGAQYVVGEPWDNPGTDQNCEDLIDNTALNSKDAYSVRIGVTGQDSIEWMENPPGIFNYRDLHLDYEPASGGWGFKVVIDPSADVNYDVGNSPANGGVPAGYWWSLQFTVKSIENWDEDATWLGGETCSDPTYDNDNAGCIANGTCEDPAFNNNEAGCATAGTCSRSPYNNEYTNCTGGSVGHCTDTTGNNLDFSFGDDDQMWCLNWGSCDLGGGNPLTVEDQMMCEMMLSGTWTQATWTQATWSWNNTWTSHTWTPDGKCLITNDLWPGGPGADWMQETSFTTREMCMEQSQNQSQWDSYYFMWIENTNTWRNIYHHWTPTHSGWWLSGGGPYEHWGIGNINPIQHTSWNQEWQHNPNLDLDSTFVYGTVQYHKSVNVLTSESQRIYPKKHFDLIPPVLAGTPVTNAPDVPTEFTMYHQDQNQAWGNGEEVGRSTIPMWLTNSFWFPDHDRLYTVCEHGAVWGDEVGVDPTTGLPWDNLEDCHASGTCVGQPQWDNDQRGCRGDWACDNTGLYSWYGPSSMTCNDPGYESHIWNEYLFEWEYEPTTASGQDYYTSPDRCWDNTSHNVGHYSCYYGGYCTNSTGNCTTGNYGNSGSYNGWWDYPCNGLGGEPNNNGTYNQGTACYCYNGKWTNDTKCLNAGVCERWWYFSHSSGPEWRIASHFGDVAGSHSNYGSNHGSGACANLATNLANWCSSYTWCSNSETRWFSDNNTWTLGNNGSRADWGQVHDWDDDENTWLSTVPLVVDEVPLTLPEDVFPVGSVEYARLQYPPHLFVSATTYGGYSSHCENGAFNNQIDCENGGSTWIVAVEYPAAQPVEEFGYHTPNRPEGALIRWKPPEQEKDERDKFYPRPSHFRIYRSPWVSPEGLSFTGSDYEADIWRLAGEVPCTGESDYHYFTDTREDLIKAGVKPYERVYYRITGLWKNWNWKRGYEHHIFGRTFGPDLNYTQWDPRKNQHWSTYGVEHWIDEAQAFELLDGMCSTTNLPDESTKREAGCLGHGTCSWPQFNNDEASCIGQGHCSDPQFNNDELTCINLPQGVCSDPQFNNLHPDCVTQGLCVEYSGGNNYSSDWNNNSAICLGHGGLCYSTGLTENGVSDDSLHNDEAGCLVGGTCSDPTYNNDEYGCLNQMCCSGGGPGSPEWGWPDSSSWGGNGSPYTCGGAGTCVWNSNFHNHVDYCNWYGGGATEQNGGWVPGNYTWGLNHCGRTWTPDNTWNPHVFVNHTFANHTWTPAGDCYDSNGGANPAFTNEPTCLAEGECSDVFYNNNESGCTHIDGGDCSNSVYDGNYSSCLNDGTCSDPAWNGNQPNCETYGTCSVPLWNNDEAGCLASGTCTPDGQYNNDEVGCLAQGICSDGTMNDYANCIINGTCSDPGFIDEDPCLGIGTCNIPGYDNDPLGCLGLGTCWPNTGLSNNETACLAQGTCTGTPVAPMYDDWEFGCLLLSGTCSDPAHNDDGFACLHDYGTCTDSQYDNDYWGCVEAGETFTHANTWTSDHTWTSAGNTWTQIGVFTSSNTWTLNTWTPSNSWLPSGATWSGNTWTGSTWTPNTWTSANNTWSGPVWTSDNYTWTPGEWNDSTFPYGDNPIAPFDFSAIETPAGGIVPPFPSYMPEYTFKADLSTEGWGYNPYEVNTFRYAGYFRAPETGEYTFQVVSKSSSYLWLGADGESITTLVGYRDHTNNLSGVPGLHSSGVEFRNGYIDLVAGETYPLIAYFSSNWFVGQTVFKIRVHYPSGEWNDGGVGLDNDGNDIGEWKYAQYEMMPGDMSPTGGQMGQMSANGQNCEGIESGFYNIVTNSQSEITDWDVPDDTVAVYSFYTDEE